MSRKNSKEKTTHLIKRYIWLVDTISRKKGITFEEISEKWEKSGLNENKVEFPLRTFHNHREAIEDLFGIEIVCDKKNGYKYELEGGLDDTQKRWLFNTFSVVNLLSEAQNLQLKNRILLEDTPSGREFLSPITTALNGNFQLKISYQKFQQSIENEIVIYPYLLKYFKQRWYVLGYKPSAKAIRIYALDRIKSVEVLADTFSLPNDFSPEDTFSNYFGIILDEDIECQKITLKVLTQKANYLKSLPLHHSQKEIKTEGEFTFFEYYLRPTYDFRQEILSHGAEIEVISPPEFREKIAEIIHEMQKLYQ